MPRRKQAPLPAITWAPDEPIPPTYLRAVPEAARAWQTYRGLVENDQDGIIPLSASNFNLVIAAAPFRELLSETLAGCGYGPANAPQVIPSPELATRNRS